MDKSLQQILSVADARKLARQRLPRPVFDFVDGGSGDELTLADNRTAFDRLRIVPRVLTDVSAPDMSTMMLGKQLQVPLVIAPMGSCALVWPKADFCIARAAASRGIPYTLSTMSTAGIEDMARAVQGELWFQLYVLKDREFNFSLIDRARDAGYSALVVTVDLQAGGKREKDLRNGISLPLRLSANHVIEGIKHPGWAMRLLRHGFPDFANVKGLLGDQSAGTTIAALVGNNLDAAFDWDGLARIRERWPGKLLVKGVMHRDDASRMVGMGVDGLWVSNHGGRQLDGALASADALAGVAKAAGTGTTIILDSGVRRGSDVLKARALGAHACAVGRAALFGAAAGEAGVAHVLEILIAELQLGMKLAGTPKFNDIGPDLLANP